MLKRALVHKLKNNQGLSLLEIMVAIAVATIAMTALVVVSNTAVRGVDTARGRTTADQYVREGVEQLRAYRDQEGYTVLTAALTDGGAAENYSLNSSGVPVNQTHTGLPPCDLATLPANQATYRIGSTPYFRIISQKREGNQDRVVVYVCYDLKNNKYQSASAETLLTNWR